MIVTEIITDDSFMELIKHGCDEFPIQYYYDKIKNFKTGSIPHHWHKEFELVVVTEGQVYCSIGTEKFILNEGDGLFINTNIIHQFECTSSNNETLLEDILFSPEFISPKESVIYDKYIYPFINTNISHCILKKDTFWQNEIILNLIEIFELFKSNEPLFELKIHESVSKIWRYLYSNLESMCLFPSTKSSIVSQARAKQMVQYIEENYYKKISLNDIAISANISKSEALRCFNDNLKISPIKYLIQFRLYKAKSLLGNKHINISQISSQCGFDSTSYFDRLFKRYYGVSPKEYRK